MLIKLNHPKRIKWDPGNVWLQELLKKRVILVLEDLSCMEERRGIDIKVVCRLKVYS